MNPFDLPGPQFLLFFWMFAVVVLVLAGLVRRRVEEGEVPKLAVVDPYVVACLRGGQEEAIKLAVLSLCERGLLTEDGRHGVKTVDVMDNKFPQGRIALQYGMHGKVPGGIVKWRNVQVKPL